MFFQILIRGNLRLWWQGNLPHNLRRLWHERHWWGADPVLCSVLTHMLFTVAAVTFLFFSVLAVIAVTEIDLLVSRPRLAELGVVTFFACLFSFMMGLINVKEVSQGFYHGLLDVKEYLGLSFREIDALSFEGLRHHAEESLRDSGGKLRDAELQFPSFHPKVEKLRRDFKSRYATFLNLGMIEDVGYGSFIPLK